MGMVILILASLIFIACYILGGQSFKWARKWVGSIVFGLSVILNLYLIQKLSILGIIGGASYLLASNSFSYGVDFTQDKLSLKILFRGLCGAMYGLSGLLIAISVGMILGGIQQVLLAVGWSIYLGAFNPIGSRFGNKSTYITDGIIALSYILIVFIILIQQSKL